MARASDLIFSDRTGDSAETVDTQKAKSSMLGNLLVSSSGQIWKSRISWRIIIAVFLTILTVQAIILNFRLKEFETGLLDTLRENGRAAIAPLIVSNSDLLASPFTDESIARLFSATSISAIAVYSSQLDLIKTYGGQLALFVAGSDSLSRTYRSADGTSYEVIYRSSDLRLPYVIVARLDSAHVRDAMVEYVRQTFLVMMLMSALVTTVLMIALGRWLLEPILFMRANLLAASKSPEDPKIQPSPFDPNDEIGGAIKMAQDLIHQNAANLRHFKHEARSQIHKLAYYDTLTSLPNRTLFLQNLAHKAKHDDDEEVPRFAVVTIDIDHFKDINDSMCHNVGDAILKGVGKRLRAAMPETAVVARMDADEFAIMMPLSTDINTARDVAERVLGVIRSEPFKVFNENFQVRASIGASTFPNDSTDPDSVLKNADIALNRAKEEGRDRIKEYNEDFDRAVQQRFQMLRDLRDAMEQRQLSVYFQPQLDLKTGEIIGAEALLRWWKPDSSKQGGVFIPPNEFIPVAEQSGLIVPIGEWVMDVACQAAADWNKKLGKDLRIAVNVAAAQFIQGDIVNYVQKVLRQTGLAANKLELEVTESVFMHDIEHTIRTLQSLHAIGVELAIDDFGTGYSSLSYLRQFPIDRLKIDQSFIRNALNDNNDASIARTIVRLGHSLNLKVIAEGVETKEHEKFLLAEGCDEAQGYRYCRPVPHEKFVEFAQNYDGKLSSFDQT
ncbi:MAG: EAL domain-containing protein [Micavibrio sp.]|nr:EAL domain-containing protein [Micavibrio sp.]